MKQRYSRFRFVAVFALVMLWLPGALMAQVRPFPPRPTSPDELAIHGCACGACGLIAATVGLITLVVHVLILIWVARDAKARGMENPVLWLLLIVFAGVIGLIVYICVRPAGSTVPCPNCHNRRLEGLAKCPHCGNP